MKAEHLLEIKDLKLHYPVQAGLLRKQVGSVKAVDGVTLEIRRGEILGLVGESGCGKSSLGRCILQLSRATSGQVLYRDQDLVPMKKKQVRALRKDLQMICQDPYSSLDPRQTVGSAVGEGLLIHGLAKDSVSGSASPGPWLWIRSSSYAMSLCPPWTYLSRRRSSIC